MQLNRVPAAALPLLAAADLQDNLLMVATDLDRLQRLLTDACDAMLVSFGGATEALRAADSAQPAAVERAIAHLGTAVVALQFQDMASQLIAHTHRRLRHCTDRLADDAFSGDDDGETVIEPQPLRPNPVTQDEMDAGSVTLF